MEKLHPLDIPLIFDKICSFLSIKELTQCRGVNHHWHSMVTNVIKRRGSDNYPMVTLTNLQRIVTHLTFLEQRKNESIEWLRTYKLDLDMEATRIILIMDLSVKLIDQYGQKIVSMILKYNNMFDDHFKLIVPSFRRLIAGVKEMRVAGGHLHHESHNDPRYFVRMLNSIPNLTKLTLCYTRMLQEFISVFCDYYCLALSQLDRISQLEHLTVSLNYLSFQYIEDLAEMTSLKSLHIFVQGESRFNEGLFKFLSEKCPRLEEIYLIRLGPTVKPWSITSGYPPDDKGWLKNTRKLEIEFPKIKIVVEKRY